MTKEIPITKGYAVVVDDSDFEWLSLFKWYAIANNRGVYAAHPQMGPGKALFAERLICNRGLLTSPIASRECASAQAIGAESVAPASLLNTAQPAYSSTLPMQTRPAGTAQSIARNR